MKMNNERKEEEKIRLLGKATCILASLSLRMGFPPERYVSPFATGEILPRSLRRQQKFN